MLLGIQVAEFLNVHILMKGSCLGIKIIVGLHKSPHFLLLYITHY